MHERLPTPRPAASLGGMLFSRPSLGLVLLAMLAFTGCGYVHFGHLPEVQTTVVGDEKLLTENSDLRLEKKMLQQELALARAQGDALRFAIENRNADGDTSKHLTEKLNDTTRELATLRANYAKLQIERASAPTTDLADLKSKLGATEDKLAGTLRSFTDLQQEVAGLRAEVEQKRTENAALAEQVKTVTAQSEQAKAALAQLNTDFLAQKDARTRAEQDATTLRTQLETANTKISVLSRQRTAAAGDATSLAVSDNATAPLSDSADLRTQLEGLRKKVWSLAAERHELQQQLTAAENQIKRPGVAEAKAMADALSSAKMLREENEQLKSSNVELAKNKSDLEAVLAKSQAALPAAVGAIREELAQTKAMISSLTDENARLKARQSPRQQRQRHPRGQRPRQPRHRDRQSASACPRHAPLPHGLRQRHARPHLHSLLRHARALDRHPQRQPRCARRRQQSCHRPPASHPVGRARPLVGAPMEARNRRPAKDCTPPRFRLHRAHAFPLRPSRARRSARRLRLRLHPF